MIGLLQRVTGAQVVVADDTVVTIGPGLLVLIGMQRGDGPQAVARLLERLITYRVFPDQAGRMNRSLQETHGDLLLVPQFTLAADTRQGTRPGFSGAADPAQAAELFALLCEAAKQRVAVAEAGVFGADMQVWLCNDGPVTFWLEVAPDSR